MDHILCSQVPAGGPGGLGVRDRSILMDPGVRFFLYGRTALPDDRTCYTRTVLQIFIGRVDDRLRRLCGYVALRDLDGLAGGKNAFDKNVIHTIILLC